MEQPKVSVIVPVYKVENFLRRCLDSLVNQTLKEMEIICVNDGSPDNCLSILKEYEAKYQNIVIIDKQNEGVWQARFDGIMKATGEYITFVDSDDYVALDCMEKLYSLAQKDQSDMVVTGFYRIDEETNHTYSKEMTAKAKTCSDLEKNPEEILSINTALWNKLYKAETLKNIKNIENKPKALEDMMFLLLVYLNVKKVSFMNEALYYYMTRPDGAMAGVKPEVIEPSEKSMLEIKKMYADSEIGKARLEIVDAMAFLHFGISLMFRFSYDKKNFGKILNENREFLNKEFPMWKKTKYLKLWYCIAHKGKNLKVAVMQKIYYFRLFKLFLVCYRFVIDKLKVDIKW